MTTKKKANSSGRSTVPFITRHRPKTFDDIIGMETQLKTVSTGIEQGSIPNAYLLVGTTGCGKTTLARILARTVMCENRNACGECQSCRISDADIEQHPDYKEVNCGVDGKVDDIRGLIRMSSTVPQIGKMRVIVLDEAHRLSGASLEALLKPLEEPAERTLWILATTEANSLKDTLKNRCYKIYISPAPADILGKYLARISYDEIDSKVSKKEYIKLTNEIAQMTGGYIRESLQVLDSVVQTISSGDYESATEIIEIVRNDLLNNVEADSIAAQTLVMAIVLNNPKALVQLLANHDNFYSLITSAVNTTQYLIDDIWSTKGKNIYHPPVFRETADSIRDRLQARKVTKENRLLAYNAALTALLELNHKLVSVSCPDRPLITSILLNASFEIKRYTRDIDK